MSALCPVCFSYLSLCSVTAVHTDCGATAAWHACAPQLSLSDLRCLHLCPALRTLAWAACQGSSVFFGSYARASPVRCCCACVLAWQRLTAARLRSAAVLALLSVPLLAAGAPASFAEQADPSVAPMAAPALA